MLVKVTDHEQMKRYFNFVLLDDSHMEDGRSKLNDSALMLLGERVSVGDKQM